MGTTQALPTMPTPPEPPRNHGNPGEIDNIDDIDNIENFNDEDECESHENDYENDGAKNFEGAAGQKLKAGGKPARLSEKMEVQITTKKQKGGREAGGRRTQLQKSRRGELKSAERPLQTRGQRSTAN